MPLSPVLCIWLVPAYCGKTPFLTLLPLLEISRLRASAARSFLRQVFSRHQQKKSRMKFPAFFATGQKAAVPRCRRFSGTVHTGQNAGELFRTFRKLRNPFQRVGDGMVRLSPLSCFTAPSSWPGRISSSRPVLPRSASPHRPRCRRRGSKHTTVQGLPFPVTFLYPCAPDTLQTPSS